jgi:F0F1-type ATP synthase assembly protein I
MFSRDKNFNQVLTVLVLQCILGGSFSIICLLVTHELRDLFSAGLGFGLVVIPTLVYIKVAFAKGVIVLPHIAIGLHKKAIIYRFIISTVLFSAVCIGYKNCNFLILFLSYLVTLSGYWFGLLKVK